MKIRVYLAQKMTGRYCDEMVREAKKITRIFNKAGIEVISPVLQEKVPAVHRVLDYVTKEKLLKEWALDKYERMGQCHILYNANADMHSNGVTVERGIHRWLRWRPVINYIPFNKYFFSITDIEEDGVFHSHTEAARYIIRTWGSRKLWLTFKLKHVLIDVPKFIVNQIRSLWL